MSWAAQVYVGLTKVDNLPTPNRKNIFEWAKDAFDQTQNISVRTTFEHIGYIRSDTPFPPTPCPSIPLTNFNENDALLGYRHYANHVKRQEDFVDESQKH